MFYLIGYHAAQQQQKDVCLLGASERTYLLHLSGLIAPPQAEAWGGVMCCGWAAAGVEVLPAEPVDRRNHH